MILEAGLATSILDAKRQPIADVWKILDYRAAKDAVAAMNDKQHGAERMARNPHLARILRRMEAAVHPENQVGDDG